MTLDMTTDTVFPIPQPDLRIKVSRGRTWRTYCGSRCDFRFGIIAPVGKRRLHLVEIGWVQVDFQVWQHPGNPHKRAARGHGRLRGQCFALEPEAVLTCPKCGSRQRLPDGVAEMLEESGTIRWGALRVYGSAR